MNLTTNGGIERLIALPAPVCGLGGAHHVCAVPDIAENRSSGDLGHGGYVLEVVCSTYCAFVEAMITRTPIKRDINRVARFSRTRGIARQHNSRRTAQHGSGKARAHFHRNPMDRLARNAIDLLRTVQELTDRGVSVEFVKEGQRYTGEAKPEQTLMLQVLAAVAQFERAILKERQREGIAIARAKGLYKGRRHRLTPERADELRAQHRGGSTVVALAKQYGVSRETVYSYLRAA